MPQRFTQTPDAAKRFGPRIKRSCYALEPRYRYECAEIGGSVQLEYRISENYPDDFDWYPNEKHGTIAYLSPKDWYPCKRYTRIEIAYYVSRGEDRRWQWEREVISLYTAVGKRIEVRDGEGALVGVGSGGWLFPSFVCGPEFDPRKPPAEPPSSSGVSPISFLCSGELVINYVPGRWANSGEGYIYPENADSAVFPPNPDDFEVSKCRPGLTTQGRFVYRVDVNGLLPNPVNYTQTQTYYYNGGAHDITMTMTVPAGDYNYEKFYAYRDA